MDPATVDAATGLIRVCKTLQVSSTPRAAAHSPVAASITAALADVSIAADTAAQEAVPKAEDSAPAYPHIFAIGDAADAFDAIPAGHNAYAQGELAAKNIVRLIENATSDGEAQALHEYTASPPAIKVSLGLVRSSCTLAVFLRLMQHFLQTNGVYQVGPNIGLKTDGVPDLQAASIWPYFGIKVESDEDMRA